MATTKRNGTGNGGGGGSSTPPVPSAARSLLIASRGVKTSRDFAGLMSSLMGDLLQGSVSAGIGNAVCNAGGKLLKVIEMEERYGRDRAKRPPQALRLAR